MIRIRLSALFFTLILLSFGAVAWLTHQQMMAQSKQQSIEKGQSHLSLVSAGLQKTIKEIQNDFLNNPSHFLFYARVRWVNSASAPQFEQTRFAEASDVQKWAQAYTLLAIQNQQIAKMSADSVGIYSIIDPKRKAYVLVVDRFSSEEARVGIVGTEVFLNLIKQSADLKPVIYNSQYQAILHWDSAYNGAILKGDANVDAINASADVSNFIEGKQGFVFFEKMMLGNVTVYLTEDKAAAPALPWQIFFVGCGIALLAVGLVWSFYKPEVVEVSAAQSLPMEVPKVPTAEEAKTLTKQFAETVWPFMNSILTFARAAEVQAQSEGIRYNIRQIENQARLAKEVLAGLRGEFEDVQTSEKVKVADLVDKGLNPLRSRITVEKVQLTVNVPSDLEVLGSKDIFAKAVRLIAENALDAMRASMIKSLKIHADHEGDFIVLTVEDSGPGMSPQQIEKAKEPFFTTKENANGLGIPTATSILNSSGGSLTLESVPAKGTKVRLSFRKNFEPHALIEAAHVQAEQEEKEDFVVAPVVQTPPTVEISEKTMALDPLIVDDSVEKIIDEMDTEIIAKPTERKTESKPVRVDMPHFRVNKKKSAIDEYEVAVRKPNKSEGKL